MWLVWGRPVISMRQRCALEVAAPRGTACRHASGISRSVPWASPRRPLACAPSNPARPRPSVVGMLQITTTDPAGPAALRALARQLRVDAVRAVAAAGSGHPSSALSAADLMAVLLAKHLRYDFDLPEHPGNDHLIFSKGHASPLLYAMYRAAGAVSDEELLTYRRLDSRLEGHPTPRLPWVDVATGSLGLGLPVGVGLGLAGKGLAPLPYRVWVLTGDSELAEGSMWEAFARAAHAGLDNLVAIVDVNRLGQSGETMLAGTPPPTPPAPLAGGQSRSTATTSRPSTAPTPTRSSPTGARW